jgi:peroxiredoxin
MALHETRGRVTLVHFWATWCVACRHEMPLVERLWQRYRKDGLTVLGVNVDRGDADAVRAFAREYGMTFPVLLDRDGAARARYGVRALPLTYIIGRDGRIVGRIFGERDWSSPSAGTMIEALLQSEPDRGAGE